MKYLTSIAFGILFVTTAFAQDAGECRTVSFSNGIYDLEEGSPQCNPDEGFFPLLDPENGNCTCEKTFNANFELDEVSEKDPSRSFSI